MEAHLCWQLFVSGDVYGGRSSVSSSPGYVEAEVFRTKIWIDGKLYDKADAKISVYDHGLLYGDGVFEGMRVFDGGLFRANLHMDRIERSAIAAAQTCSRPRIAGRRRRTGSRSAAPCRARSPPTRRERARPSRPPGGSSSPCAAGRR